VEISNYWVLVQTLREQCTSLTELFRFLSNGVDMHYQYAPLCNSSPDGNPYRDKGVQTQQVAGVAKLLAVVVDLQDAFDYHIVQAETGH
jgi:hypothetical protein